MCFFEKSVLADKKMLRLVCVEKYKSDLSADMRFQGVQKRQKTFQTGSNGA